jgi:hypothetical protein
MNRLLLIGLIVIVTGALIAGFSVVGGPGYARLEKADAQRAQDLQQRHAYLQCNWEDAVLPTTLEEDGYCSSFSGNITTTDPATGEAYTYERTNDRSFKVCATFATNTQKVKGEYTFRSLTFEGQTGCREGVSVKAVDR